MDTQERTLVATGGKVWTTASDKERPLFAVHPATLVDEVDFAGLNYRIPALSAGVYLEPGGEPPVAFADGALLMRLNSGPVLAMDPATLATRDGSLDTLEDAQRAGTPRGDRRLEALVETRPDLLEPRIAPVFNLDGTPDPSVGFVVTQTSLDMEQAGVRVSRWALGETPAEGWTTPVPDVTPTCCNVQAWRADGLAIVWYEEWLLAFDDASGALRWKRRL